MSVHLRNLRASSPLHVPLTSGESVRLSPEQSSPEIPEAEVLNNPKVTRLVEAGDLEIVQHGGGPRRARAAGSAKPAEQPEEKRKTK